MVSKSNSIHTSSIRATLLILSLFLHDRSHHVINSDMSQLMELFLEWLENPKIDDGPNSTQHFNHVSTNFYFYVIIRCSFITLRRFRWRLIRVVISTIKMIDCCPQFSGFIHWLLPCCELFELFFSLVSLFLRVSSTPASFPLTDVASALTFSLVALRTVFSRQFDLGYIKLSFLWLTKFWNTTDSSDKHKFPG